MILGSESLKNLRPLYPFLKCVCAYAIWIGARETEHSVLIGLLLTAALKCAPVVFLAVLVHSRCSTSYSRLIAIGLLLSALGDICLVWPGLFVPGMASFGIAHMLYCAAFGWYPLKAGAAIPLMLASLAYNVIVLNPPAVLKIPVIIYSLLLSCMCWRSLIRALTLDSISGWTAAVGSVSFLVSDTILGYSMFGGPVVFRTLLVMSCYYFGQLGLAVSALEESSHRED